MKAIARVRDAIVSAVFALGLVLTCSLSEKSALRLSEMHLQLFDRSAHAARKRKLRALYPKREATEEAIKQLAETNLQYWIRVNAEISRGQKPSAATFRERSPLKGEEHLKKALKEGRGVILLGAHFGSFLVPPALLGLNGYDVTIIGSPLYPASLERHIARVARDFNCRRAVPGAGAGFVARSVFRRNGILYAMFDLSRNRKSCIELPFMGRILWFDPGTVRLAVRFKVPVVPVISYCDKPYQRDIYLEPAFPQLIGSDEKELVRLMMQQWSSWLETKVKARPDQWCWPYVPLVEKLREEANTTR